MIAFILGIFSSSLLPALLPLWIYAVLILSFAVVFIRTHKAFQFGISWIAFFCGALWFTLYAGLHLDNRMPEPQAGEWFIKGVVSQLPENLDGRIRFTMNVVEAIPVDKAASIAAFKKLRLSWYQPQQALLPGDYLELKAKLKPPHALANPYSFDYERWALVKGIDATGYIKQLHLLKSGAISIDGVRSDIALWLDDQFSEKPEISSTFRALLLGDRRGLSDRQWELLRTTGTSHLLVVSGLHIGICVALGWWLGRLLLFIRCQLSNTLGLRSVEASYLELYLPVFSALLLSAVYVAFAGFSLPTQRAWIMAAVFLIGLLWQRPLSVWTRWLIAMALVLLVQPFAVYEVGFWLSFGAVGILLVLLSRRDNSGVIKRAIYTQCWISLLMSPLLIIHFGEVALIAPFVNILAIPFIMMLLAISLPALVLAYFGVPFLLQWVGSLLGLFWAVTDWLVTLLTSSDSQLFSMISFTANPYTTFFLVVGLLLIIQPVIKRLKLLGVVCLLPLLFPLQKSHELGVFSAVVFDVGQGNAVLVKTRDHHLLYDTGAAYRSGGSAFANAVLPYLKSSGITHLDKLVISHSDNDHAGGLSDLLANNISVTGLEGGSPYASLPANNLPYEYCHDEQSWQWNDVTFRYLTDQSHGEQRKTNNQSCILEVRSSNCAFLLTGDADLSTERSVLEKVKPVSWLMAGHHGSRNSTGGGLLDKASPAAVVISAGYLNRYGHPSNEVLERIEGRGADYFRTDLQGAIFLSENEEGDCIIETWRSEQKRFWSKG